MEQISERTDRVGSERDVGEGSYLQSNSRPLINLKNLKKFAPYQHFKMEGFHCLKFLSQNRDYMCKVDSRDAYFSVAISKESRKLVKFQ